MKIRRAISLSLAALMLSASFAGCAEKSETAKSEMKVVANSDSISTTVTQEQMPEEKLQSALVNLEYSMLSAAMASDEYVVTRTDMYRNRPYLGDLDGDSQNELVYGNGGMNALFDIDNQRVLSSFFAQGGVMYIDKDGLLWNTQGYSGPVRDNENQSQTISTFCKWTYGEWKQILSRKTVSVYGGGVVETGYMYVDGDRVMTQEEFDSYGFVPLESGSFDYTIYDFDVKYKNHLIAEFINTLSGYYNISSYDVTGTNGEEKIIVVSNAIDNWYSEYCSRVDEAYETLDYWKFEDSRSVVIVVSSDDKKVTFKSCGYCGNLSSSNIEIKDCYIKVGNCYVTTHANFNSFDCLSDSNKTQWFEGFKEYLSNLGYSKIIFKIADISEQKGDELICVAEYDGVLQMLVFALSNGIPVEIYSASLSNDACYFVEYNGALYLLVYHHRVSTTSGGDTQYNYSCDVIRFGENCERISIFEEDLSYYNNDKDATEAANFFAKLNEYLTSNLVVIYDPFVLTGKQWLSESEIDFGETPEQTVFPEENNSDKTRIGFVEVDTNSWLNFREGAGTNYSKVLVDPANPDSFIKLAKGTPVTILDEVTTKDSKNPLWYKIQINFGDKTFVGYSSATYIKAE